MAKYVLISQQVKGQALAIAQRQPKGLALAIAQRQAKGLALAIAQKRMHNLFCWQTPVLCITFEAVANPSSIY